MLSSGLPRYPMQAVVRSTSSTSSSPSYPTHSRLMSAVEAANTAPSQSAQIAVTAYKKNQIICAKKSSKRQLSPSNAQNDSSVCAGCGTPFPSGKTRDQRVKRWKKVGAGTDHPVYIGRAKSPHTSGDQFSICNRCFQGGNGSFHYFPVYGKLCAKSGLGKFRTTTPDPEAEVEAQYGKPNPYSRKVKRLPAPKKHHPYAKDIQDGYQSPPRSQLSILDQQSYPTTPYYPPAIYPETAPVPTQSFTSWNWPDLSTTDAFTDQRECEDLPWQTSDANSNLIASYLSARKRVEEQTELLVNTAKDTQPLPKDDEIAELIRDLAQLIELTLKPDLLQVICTEALQVVGYTSGGNPTTKTQKMQTALHYVSFMFTKLTHMGTYN
jgi:hypothetical protein